MRDYVTHPRVQEGSYSLVALPSFEKELLSTLKCNYFFFYHIVKGNHFGKLEHSSQLTNKTKPFLFLI